MTQHPIAVLGATGKTGRAVAHHLASAGTEFRPLSRHAPIPFDWTADATWAPALAGARALYLVPPEPGAADLAPFVDAAVAGGVERIVLLSARNPGQSGSTDLLENEALVAAAPVRWTIVRPSWFDQNFDAGFFRPGIDAGELRLPVGEGREPFVDTTDIAAVVVAALTSDGHDGATYELSGPEALSFADAIGEIAAASGRDIRFADVPPTEHADELRAFGVPDAQIDALLHLYGAIRAGDNDNVSDGVQRALGREPRTFAEYASATWRPAS